MNNIEMINNAQEWIASNPIAVIVIAIVGIVLFAYGCYKIY